ncbi:MAG: hypothetical protein WA765_02090, partial [Candidatus Acidiferrum sp.]
PRISGVISSSRKPVSAKQNLSRPRPRGFAVVCHLLGFFLVCFLIPRNARADSLKESARALARKVWFSTRATTVTCDFRNLSTLRRAEFANLSAAFEEELQRRGVIILPADAAVNLVVSVTQDPAEYIGVVQIQRKESTETVMEAIGPVNGPAAPEPAFSLALHREFLFSQDNPILDVLFDANSKLAFVLGIRELGTYELRDEHWVLTGAEPLPRHRAPKRSERGYLTIGIESEAIVFPEEFCTMSLLPGTKGWDCQKNSSGSGVRGISAETMAGKNLGAWISGAPLEAGGKTRIVVTGDDGLARLYEDGAEPVAVFSNWGSEIASVYSGCGSGWQLLVTGKGDWTKHDEIQAIDLQERRAQSVSDPMEFPGPIVALQAPGERGAPSATVNAQAVAVDRNLQTGRYDAYLLSIACTR